MGFVIWKVTGPSVFRTPVIYTHSYFKIVYYNSLMNDSFLLLGLEKLDDQSSPVYLLSQNKKSLIVDNGYWQI